MWYDYSYSYQLEIKQVFFSTRIEEYFENGSGYQFLAVDSADVYFAKFNPLRAGAQVEVSLTADYHFFLFSITSITLSQNNTITGSQVFITSISDPQIHP